MTELITSCAADDPAILYWDDIAPGFKYASASRTITEADMVAFCALSADQNRLHVDAEYAATAAYGQRLVPGMLVLSYMAGLHSRTIFNQRIEHALIAVLELNCRFPAPTFIGDTLHLQVEVLSCKPTSKAERGVSRFRRCAVNQHGTTVAECEIAIMMLRRPEAEK
jgi:acyl dehydratase